MLTLKEIKDKYIKKGIYDIAQVIKDGHDPHIATAMLMFNVDDPTVEQRKCGKNFNAESLYYDEPSIGPIVLTKYQKKILEGLVGHKLWVLYA